MIHAIILAAGESKRMGLPKPLLRFPRSMGVPPMSSRGILPLESLKSDTTFLEQIVAVLRQSDVDGITVVLGAYAQEVRRSTDLSGTGITVNERYQEGQLSSLIAGLQSVQEKGTVPIFRNGTGKRGQSPAEAILLCLVDNPLITCGIVNRIVGAFRETGKPIIVPIFQGRRGHPALFARPVFDKLLNAPADQGARHVVQSNRDRVHEVEIPEPAILARIDTPEDYRSHFGAAPQIIA